MSTKDILLEISKIREQLKILKEAEEELLYKEGFLDGWKRGVTDFAVWKDGEQLVGVRQTPLKEILDRGPI